MVKTTVDTTSDRSVRSSTILQRTIHKTIAKKPKKPREKKQVARVSEEVASSSSTLPPPVSPTSSEMSAVPAEVLSALSTEQRTALEKYIKTVATAPQKLVIPPIKALVPRLRLAIGELSHTTPEALINRCKEVLRDLRAVDASEGRRTRLPPSTPNSNENKWRDRERHQGENYRKQYFNNNQQQYGNGNQSNGNRQDRDSNRGNRQDGDANREDNRNNQKMTKQEFRNETRPRYGRQPPRTENRHADKECYRCKKKGHISRDCKATAFFFDEEDEKKEEGGAQGGGSDPSNLNDKGGH
ncbi:unnamed protein product [Orchesella dallaii]|uniref:CCHC-type domain-containing protein n=1 Tax=Orchesella dallaii TaxID=48710 RepID=A0ABP1PSA5_9HEXA